MLLPNDFSLSQVWKLNKTKNFAHQQLFNFGILVQASILSFTELQWVAKIIAKKLSAADAIGQKNCWTAAVV